VKDFPGVATSCANAPTAAGQVNGRSEAGAYPDGRADVHEQPLEPFMVRFTI
jgi:hypothetical protein